MRVLVSTFPEPSHMEKVVPLMWALRCAGHDVLVIAPPNLVPSVRAYGLDAVALADACDMTQELQDRLARFGPGAVPIRVWPRPGERLWSSIAVWHAERARAILPEYLDIARWWSPDLIMAEAMEITGRVAGGLLGIPVVRHRWGLDPLTDVFEARLHELLDVDCQALGLPGLPDPGLTVDPCPPSFQIPGIPAARPVRYVPVNGSGEVPAWARLTPRNPRVCVTFGSQMLQLGMGPVLGWVLEAASSLSGVELILAMPALDLSCYADVSGKVVSLGPVPLSLFLGTCSAIVHHGGSGSGLTAIRFGVPQLVLPQHSDQFTFGERIEACGNGIQLDTFESQSDPSRIRNALGELLARPGPREAAGRLAAEVAQTPPPTTLVAELEEFAACSPRLSAPITR